MLEYSVLADSYNPSLSDPVKNQFITGSSNQDLIKYFKAWFMMLLKHPSTYIDAYLANYYQYFYPSDTRFYPQVIDSVQYMYRANLALGVLFHYPSSLLSIEQNMAQLQGVWKATPIAFLLDSPVTYIWLLILCFSYSMRRQRSLTLTTLLLPIGVLLICLLGPTNAAYGRYMYPIVLTLPTWTILTLCGKASSDISDNGK